MRRTANGRQDREAKRARSRAGGIDLHALPFDRLAALSNVEGRHTFGTHLSKNGVAPRTARAALRHSSLDLTMNVYADPVLLDVAAAMEALPDLGSCVADASTQLRDG